MRLQTIEKIAAQFKTIELLKKLQALPVLKN